MPRNPRPLPLSQQAFVNMRVLRDRVRMSQRALAERLTEEGVPTTRQVLAGQERGGVVDRMSVDQAVALTRIFNVSLDQLCREPLCEQCKGIPPVGYTCNSCGTTT